jgi:succinate-semialdehyde dehydrogenase/glutarate-semialdehyde dehydrogenase
MAVLAERAGLPKGLLSVVTGSATEIGGEMTSNPTVRKVTFTGSTAVGIKLMTQSAPQLKKLSLELGGNAPFIVFNDGDLDAAVQGAMASKYRNTGQTCVCANRLLVQSGVYEAFTEKLIALAKSWKVGPGLAAGVQMGPAVNEAELQGNLDAITQAQSEGAELLWGGARLTDGELAHGWFMQPAVLGSVTPTMRIAREEVFGPVVGILAVDSFDEAIQVANGVEYGLSASLITRDFKKAMLYSERIEAGVVKVNQISTGLALHVPFGGVKQSSTDTFREQGTAALDFYTRSKTIYLDYSA